MTVRARILRLVRAVGVAAGAVVGLVLLALIAFLALEPLRNAALDRALPAIDEALPGRLAVESARWPAAGRLEFAGIRWVDEADTLAAIDTLAISVALDELLSRDVHVRNVKILGVEADLGILPSKFPASEVAETPSEKSEPSTPLFPRVGALAPLPSIAVDTLRIEARSLALSDTSSLSELALVAGAELRAGHRPRVRIDELSGKGGGIDLAGARLLVKPDEGVIEGGARATRNGETFRLEVASPGTTSLSLEEGTELARLTTEFRPRHDDGALTGVDVEGELRAPGTRELAALRDLAASLEGKAEIDGPTLEFRAGIALVPRVAFFGELEAAPNGWLESASVRLDHRDGVTVLDTLDLGLPQARIAASARIASDSLRARTRLRVDGTRWLSILAPGTALPESLVVDLDATVEGATLRPRVDARLGAAARFGEFVLDRVDVVLAAPEDEPARVAIAAEARELRAVVEAEIDRPAGASDSLAVRLTPIRVTGASEPDPGEERPRSGTILYELGSLSAKRVRIEGALGDLELEASLDSLKRGTVDVAWSCPAPPPPLQSMLAERPGAFEDLVSTWASGGEPFLRVSGEITGSAQNLRVDANGTLALPGPGALRSFLPDSARVDDLGPLRASFEAVAETAGEFEAKLDLAETDWISTGLFSARGGRGRVAIDSCALDLGGLTVHGAGEADADTLDVRASIRIEELEFFRRVLAKSPQDLDLDVTALAELSGTPEAPRALAKIVGSGQYEDHAFRELDGRVEWNAGRAAASLTASADLAGGTIALERIATSFTSLGEETFPARARLELTADELGLVHSVHVDRDSSWVATIDTLSVSYQERDLNADGPIRIAANPGTGELRIEDLSLKGSLATIEAEVSRGEGTLRASVSASVPVPPMPDDLAIPAQVWPESLTVNLETVDGRELEVDLRLIGLELTPGEASDLQLFVESGADSSLATRIQLDEFVAGSVRVPALVSVDPFALEPGNEPLSGRIEIARLPLPVPEREDGRFAALDGEIVLGGPLADPRARADFEITFPDWPLLADHRFEAHVAYSDSLTSTTSVSASFGGSAGAETLFGGQGLVPFSLSLVPFRAEEPAGETLTFEVNADELSLARFNPLLPNGMNLEGLLDLHLLAEGPRDTLNLDGELTATRVEATTHDGLRIGSSARISIAGTTVRPEIEGRIDVQHGMIPVPERQTKLHPLEGEALLAEIPDWRSSADSLARAQRAADSLEAVASIPEADLDIVVVVPGALWIRGRNMEFELAGELAVAQKGADPTVTGELKAVGGHLTFVGRRFEVKRGEVLFFGDDEVNPGLDVALRTDVDEKTFWIEVTGTAREPELAFRAEPEEMDEGDIISYLIFGAPMGELDGGQDQLMGRLAASYASAELTEKLSNVGVDMISIDAGSDDSDASLTVGKYLSPKMLLKYERALDKTAEALLNLEYLLSRQFHLNATYGTEQAGVDIRWSVDY